MSTNVYVATKYEVRWDMSYVTPEELEELLRWLEEVNPGAVCRDPQGDAVELHREAVNQLRYDPSTPQNFKDRLDALVQGLQHDNEYINLDVW